TFRMAARQEPELLPLFTQHKVHEMAGQLKVRSALEYRDAVWADGREILRQRESHVTAAGDGDLGEAVEINRERVSGLAQRDVLGRGGGNPIELASVAGDLGQQLPAPFPAVSLEKGLEHIDHCPAVPRVPEADPA